MRQQSFMLNLWISRRQDELLARTATFDAGILLVDVVLALVPASASLEVKRMSAMRWTFPPVHFTAPR
jgi:hypothetical protein